MWAGYEYKRIVAASVFQTEQIAALSNQIQSLSAVSSRAASVGPGLNGSVAIDPVAFAAAIAASKSLGVASAEQGWHPASVHRYRRCGASVLDPLTAEEKVSLRRADGMPFAARWLAACPGEMPFRSAR